MTNWFLRARFAPWFIALILAGGIAVRVANLATVSSRTPDERIYADQARKIALYGVRGQQQLVHIYLADEKTWIFPPPTRVGYLWLLAGTMKLTRVQDARAGAMLSCLGSIGSLLLLVCMGLRLCNPAVTLYALLALSFSPLDLTLACRAWQDSVFGFVGMCAVFCCCQIQRNIGKKAWYMLLMAAGSFLLLIKESGILVYGICACWVFLVLCIKHKRYAQSLLFLLAIAASVGLSLCVLVTASGGWAPFIKIMMHIKEAMPTNGYARLYQQGPWHSMAHGFWLVIPLQVILFLIGASCAWLRGTGNAVKDEACAPLQDVFGLRALLCFSAVFLAVASVTPYCQNLRYISTLYMPFYLCAGIGVWQCVCLISRRFSLVAGTALSLLFVALCVAGIMSDGSNFDRVIMQEQAPDLSIGVLKQVFNVKVRP